jgi:hypothetical protein
VARTLVEEMRLKWLEDAWLLRLDLFLYNYCHEGLLRTIKAPYRYDQAAGKFRVS